MTKASAITASWPQPDPSQTVLYVIGAQKAATTWIARQLDTHPDVHVPARKELHYWTTVRSPYESDMRVKAKTQAERLSRRAGRVGLQQMLSAEARLERDEARALSAMLASTGRDHSAYLGYLRRKAGDARILADVTPRYALATRATFEEMRDSHPNTRFVMVLRDPIDRLLSGIRHLWRHALRADPEAGGWLTRRAFQDALDDPHDPHRRRSDYATTLRRLFGAVPRDRVLVLFYESLGSPQTAQHLAAFLGLERLALDSAQVIHGGADAAWTPSADMRVRARAEFAETYDYVFDTFGAEVPAAWAVTERAERRPEAMT